LPAQLKKSFGELIAGFLIARLLAQRSPFVVQILEKVFALVSAPKIASSGKAVAPAGTAIGLDQETVAGRAAVNVNTIRNMEAAGAGAIAGRAQNVQAVQRVLEAAGVEFLNHGQPRVRMKNANAITYLKIHTG
jgi:hypothetical protein